jgi:glutamine amidotransferase
MIVIVDYGMGNLRSVEKAFIRLNASAIISANPEDISRADKLVLPGVGHFARGMSNLHERNLIGSINESVEKGVPLLGICLGMQLLTNSSEEGSAKGLGYIEAVTKKFRVRESVKVPHMGWNNVFIQESIPLLNGISSDNTFYFAHSYGVEAKSESVVTKTIYDEEFASIIRNGNVLGVQFHPEKSHDSGLKLIDNFIKNY